jgi:CRISPR-associated protein Csb3
VPFYFDSHNNSQNTPRDTGFGLYTLRNQLASQDNTRPLLELAAFIGIQRFRPVWRQDRRAYCFNVWPIPLPVSVAGVAVTGALPFPDQRVYSFRMLKRSEYMKAFLSAQPFQGD